MVWFAVFLLIVTVCLEPLSRRYARTQDLPVLRKVPVGFAGLTLLAFGMSSVTAVPAGHVGVPVLFGSVQGNALGEGIAFINPFTKVVMMSVRTETYTMVSNSSEGQRSGDDSIFAQSSDGVVMNMDVTVAYRLVETDASWVYRHIGLNFAENIVRPAARAVVPEVTSRYTFQDAYTTKREELGDRIADQLRNRISSLMRQYPSFRGQGFLIQQVLPRRIEPPKTIRESIEMKMAADQESQRMKFVLQRETQEAERKRIEAKGIRDFQSTVSEGISDKMLQWKGIEATEALAKSANAKVVVVGAGKGGLPLILNPGQ